MIDETPKPGTMVLADMADSVIDRFYTKFKREKVGLPTDLPAWCTFDKGIKIDEGILFHPALMGQQPLYIFFENGKKLYRANIEQIRVYFKEKEPWEDYDIYIFNDTMNWCIVFTHKLMYGIECFLVGHLRRLHSTGETERGT